jgi:hypothetical protein
VNVCSTYVTTGESPGCGAHFTPRKAITSSSSTAAIANNRNARKATAAAKDSPVATLGKLAQGLLNLRKPTPSDSSLKAQGQAGTERLQAAAAKGSSPALDGVGGQDQALLDYLMGNG